MATTLVLGASGFLGAEAAFLAAGGGAVALASRGARVPGFLPEDAPRFAWDASVLGSTRELISALRPEVVLNAAALSKLANCEREPGLASVLNAELPADLGELAVEYGFRLVHVSTDLVFGGRPPRGERYRESDPVSPLSVYGRTKAKGEAQLLRRAPDALVMRLPLLVGDSRGRGLGATDGLREELRTGSRPVLFEDEYRTPLSVGVAAAALLEASALGIRGVLHLAGPERISRWDLGRRVLGGGAETARRGRRADFPGANLRPADACLDASRARSLLTTELEPLPDHFGSP